MLKVFSKSENNIRITVVYSIIDGASLVVQMIKNLAAMQETGIGFLGQEDPLKKGKATHCNILARRLPSGVARSQT